MSIDPEDPASPAQARLRELLAPLREDAPAPSVELVPRVIRAARWQRGVRGVLAAVGTLAGAVGDGLRALLGPRGRPS